mmetsp:Transcript_105137/g.324311  ORF Transcript_105137/g.324311 Transcript_105137/m.324311 type:complete len:286 (+) Transcript_105137:191-1048(+)
MLANTKPWRCCSARRRRLARLGGLRRQLIQTQDGGLRALAVARDPAAGLDLLNHKCHPGRELSLCRLVRRDGGRKLELVYRKAVWVALDFGRYLREELPVPVALALARPKLVLPLSRLVRQVTERAHDAAGATARRADEDADLARAGGMADGAHRSELVVCAPGHLAENNVVQRNQPQLRLLRDHLQPAFVSGQAVGVCLTVAGVEVDDVVQDVLGESGLDWVTVTTSRLVVFRAAGSCLLHVFLSGLLAMCARCPALTGRSLWRHSGTPTETVIPTHARGQVVR